MDTINWEKLFNRSGEHKQCNTPWLVNFSKNLPQKVQQKTLYISLAPRHEYAATTNNGKLGQVWMLYNWVVLRVNSFTFLVNIRYLGVCYWDCRSVHIW